MLSSDVQIQIASCPVQSFCCRAQTRESFGKGLCLCHWSNRALKAATFVKSASLVCKGHFQYAGMAESAKRQLKIKTGSVNRLKKELGLYAKEKDKEQQRVNALKQSGADSHDIKHAENVLAEASMMVPDTRQRLEAALKDLQKLAEDLRSSTALSGCEEERAASQALKEAQQLLISSC